MTTNAADRLIARLDPATRVAILDAVCHRAPDVVVEHAYSRRLADARYLPGTLVGVAQLHGGTGDYVLLIQPHALAHRPARRVEALPVAHVLRIRAATLYDVTRVEAATRIGRSYLAGEVLAGPPLEGGV